MAQNYQRFLRILSKWPVINGRKKMDYGNFLRGLLKTKSPNEDIFPGDSAENSEKLDSLHRLLNNTHGDKYPCTNTVGATGLDLKTVEEVLNSPAFVQGPDSPFEENMTKK